MITEDELVAKVLTLLNEKGDDSSITLISEDTLSLDEQIRSLLPEAVLFVQMNKRHGTINARSNTLCTITLGTGNKGIIALPADYVTLVSLKLRNWSRACHQVLPSGSRVEQIQSNRYMASGNETPWCFDGTTQDGVAALLVYPASGSVPYMIEQFIYEARYNSSEGLSGNNGPLINAVAYQCAALLCNVHEKHNAANSFMTLASELYGGARRE